MFCTHCGAENPDASQFCSRCGTNLHASSAPSAGTSAPASTAGLYSSAPTETSGKAIASLICGILFFFLPAAVAAIILGHLSLAEIRRSAGRLAGEGTAIAGLVLGYIGVAFIPFILIIAAIAIPNLLRARMAANEASAVGSLRTIVTANVTYSSTYANGFAPDLSTLAGAEGESADCHRAQLIDKRLGSGLKSGYQFEYAPRYPSSGESSKVSPEAAAKGCTTPGTSGFTVTAQPLTRGTTGQRSFFIDETGVIRFDPNGTATVDSDPIP